MRVTKKKLKIVADNHMRAYGEEQGGKIKINVKKHKGDKAELADTIYHEKFHATHPKATEKVTYKKTKAAMKEMSYAEKQALVAKIRHKKLNYLSGATKRKLKVTASEKLEPGALITRANAIKDMNPRKRTAFLGMV